MVITNVKCKIIKKMYANEDYRIFSCRPIGNSEVRVNKYGTFSIVGNLSYLVEGQTCDLNLTDEEQNQYGYSYHVDSCSSLTSKEITPEVAMGIMCEITSKTQSKYVLSAYPNFVQMILDGKENEIDVKKIYNVKEYRLAIYCREIREKFKFLKIIQENKQYELTNSECKELVKRFETIDEVNKQLKENPYVCLVQYLQRNFEQIDPIILGYNNTLRLSFQRTESLICYILQLNEHDGSTVISANDMAKYCIDIAPELTSQIVQVTKDSQAIYYNEKTKQTALMSTFLQECEVAQFIKEKLENPVNLNIDYKKYQHSQEYDMTDEQIKILRIANEQNIGLLLGAGGCVDCETQYFNGEEWKYISEYSDGEKVLSYTDDGEGKLVVPQRYIKIPCNEMWHFETKYGINQTVCDEHRIVYWTPKGVKRECNIDEIIKKQDKNGWHGRFKTSFKYSGRGINLTDDEIRVMCAVICDGHFPNPKTNRCRMNLKKDKKKLRIVELLKNANIDYQFHQWNPKNPDYQNYIFNSPIKTKKFDSYWYQCTQEQLQVICDEIMFWDGNENLTKNGAKRSRFSTTEKETADFVQFAFSACGKRASIYINDRVGEEHLTNDKLYERKSIEYGVSVTNRDYVGLCSDNRVPHKKTSVIKVDTQDGLKYCFTVDSGMLILRRKNNIFVTGNCGKSFSIKSLISMLDDNDLTYTLVTPTGTSAKVLSKYTNRYASTIHKKILSDGEITTDFLIIDEFSFVSLDVMIMIIRAIFNHTKIIMSADEYQLPSISRGNILTDMIDSKIIPIARLTKVFRYGIGALSTVATDTRNGQRYIDANNSPIFTNPNNDKSYEFIPVSENPLEQVIKAYDTLLQTYSTDDILILSPQNIGSSGSYAISNAIQEKYNPLRNKEEVSYTRQKNNIKFRKGDKVLNTVNWYDALTLAEYRGEEKSKKVDVMNGNFGKVLDIEDGNIIAQFDNDFVVYTKKEINRLLLGYACSVNKAQGNQSLAVISINHPQHKYLNRALVYVANSRAREKLIEIGDSRTIANALDIVIINERNTMLKQLLKGE